METIMIDEFNKMLKDNKDIQKAFIDVLDFEEWFSYQGEELKNRISTECIDLINERWTKKKG